MSKYTATKSKKATWIVKNEFDTLTGKCTTTYKNSNKKVNRRRERTIDPDKHLEQYVKIKINRQLKHDENHHRSVMHAIDASQEYMKSEEIRIRKQKERKEKFGSKKDSAHFRVGSPKKQHNLS